MKQTYLIFGLITVMAIVVSVLLFNNLNQNGNTPLTPPTGTPSTGITSELTISKAPALNEIAEIILTVTAIKSTKNIPAKITLPEGFELVSGDLNWTVKLVENQPLQLRATVKAVKTGNWTILGRAPGEGDYLYITVNENSAYINEEPFPIPERGKKYAEPQ